MASVVKIKRSHVSGKAPKTSDLVSGELALNTNDGKLYSTDGVRVFEIGANVASLSVNNAYSFPTTDGDADQVLVTDGAGTLSFTDMAGGLEYVTKTSNYTATAKQGILCDTSGGAFTVTLPATPTAGDQVVVADIGTYFANNNLTVARNGSTIGNLGEDLVLDITNANVTFLYDGNTWEFYAQYRENNFPAMNVTDKVSRGQAIAMAMIFG